MENDLLSYMLNNKKMLIRYAMKFGGNGCTGRAEDIYQESLRFVATRISKKRVDTEFTSLKACAIQIVKHRGMNVTRVEKKYEYGKTKDYDFNHFQTADKYQSLDEKITFEKMMSVAKKILPKKQFEALTITLNEDKIMIAKGNRSPETMKANRRHAIIKLKEYFGGNHE